MTSRGYAITGQDHLVRKYVQPCLAVNPLSCRWVLSSGNLSRFEPPLPISFEKYGDFVLEGSYEVRSQCFENDQIGVLLCHESHVLNEDGAWQIRAIDNSTDDGILEVTGLPTLPVPSCIGGFSSSQEAERYCDVFKHGGNEVCADVGNRMLSMTLPSYQGSDGDFSRIAESVGARVLCLNERGCWIGEGQDDAGILLLHSYEDLLIFFYADYGKSVSAMLILTNIPYEQIEDGTFGVLQEGFEPSEG